MLRTNKKFILSSFGLLSALLFTVQAQAATQHVLIAPDCLINKTSSSFHSLATTNSFSLISTDNAGIEQLIAVKNASKELCGGFVDVTHAWNQYSTHVGDADAKSFLIRQTNKPNNIQNNLSYDIKYQKQVNELLAQTNPQEMWDFLTELSSAQDRYADSDTGIAAANWIKTQVETFAKNYHRDDVTVYTISTNGYKQPSVVAKIGNSSVPGIVIGAHMDTISGSFRKAPGADDDGSGSVTVLETARTLLASGMTFKKPIYLIWYAAEEEGLVGSSSVVAEFKKKQIPVEAVMHFDLTGYAHNNESTMWLMDDYVDKNLVTYISKLIDAYVKVPVKHSNCGYACSDHATWTMNGYSAAIPAEAAYEDTNPNIHSSRDTMDKLSLKHMTDYLKLASAFAVEMAEPVSK